MLPFADETRRARVAQPAWAALPLRDRLRPVRAFRHLMVERCDELTVPIRDEIDRPPDEVIATDFLPTASACKYLWQCGAKVLAPKRIGWRPFWLMGCRDTVHRRPHGVVGLIGTWNYPLFLNAVPLLHALAAGNAVLWKPSERTPRTAAVLHRWFLDAGFPPDLLIRLPATREAGPQVAEADIDFLHFTGSDGVGRSLAARLGERLVPSVLELSGCDAVFVLPDADITLAARAAWYGTTLNKGRTCMATRRAFVHRSVLPEFLDALKPLAAADPAATLILDAMPDSPVCTTAVFAQQLAVLPFDDLESAVADCHKCAFGLAASVFTKDVAAARRMAEKLPFGAVVVNDVIAPTAHPETPFGGRGASGWGETQGAEGLLQMTVPQTVTVRKGTFRPHIDTLLNREPSAGDVMRGMLRFTHGRRFRDRWRGFWQMASGMRKYGKKPG